MAKELCPIVYLDALMVRVRDEGHIQNKAIYVVLGVNLKEVLRLWVAQTEGAEFWLQNRMAVVRQNALVGRGDQMTECQADKVKSLSRNDRFVIALHSPDGVVENGLHVSPPEKRAP